MVSSGTSKAQKKFDSSFFYTKYLLPMDQGPGPRGYMSWENSVENGKGYIHVLSRWMGWEEVELEKV